MSRLSCPASEHLQEALHPSALDNVDLCEHLASCQTCRASLESIAGESCWWEDARQTLAKPRSEATLRIVSSVCALSESATDPANDASLLHHELEQLRPLLGAACHPELIGSLGRYELEQLVGRGGMGLVFRAFDTELHRIVAVKTLAIHLIPIPSARERFVREARASASLLHPHIVPVHDVITDGPVPAIVMQYVAGPTLEQWLARHGPMDWKYALEIVNQLAGALDAAHDKGLVHRDVKPGNVLLEADGSRALLSDFGLVRALDDASLTRSGILAGTPDYMSPEQARGKTVTHASDLFSLGSVSYAMLTGQPPFCAADPMAVLNKICHEKHSPISHQRSTIPQPVSRFVDSLLEKQASRRPPSATQVRDQTRKLIIAKHQLKGRSFAFLTRGAGGALVAILLVVALVYTAWIPWNSTPDQGATPPVGKSQLRAPGRSSATSEMDSGDLIGQQELDRRLADTMREAERTLEQWKQPISMHSHDELLGDFQDQLGSVDSALSALELEVQQPTPR